MADKRLSLLMGAALTGALLAGSQFSSFAQVGQRGLSLLDMAKFYSGLPQQDAALLTLQRQMNDSSPDLLRADSIVSNVWRNSATLAGHEDILGQISPENRAGGDPVEMALAIAPLRSGSPASVEVLPLDNAESPNRIMVTLDQGGFLDDSVAGSRHRFDMVLQNGQWTIQRAGRQFRCQLGRGPQDFAAGQCR
ncbi:MAG: hypothetical protein AAF703_14720 [Cyanobacteria bacterium P01_D01_bin.105]